MEETKLVSFLWLSAESVAEMFEGKTGPLSVIRAGLRHEVTEDEACEIVKDAKVIAVFPGSPNMTKRILESAEKVGFIQAFGVGYDNIDIDAATELGIPVANNPGFNATAVAEHTIMFILMTLKNALRINRLCMDGTFTQDKRRDMLPRELKGKTLGLIGLGDIGREVARLTAAFGSKVIYYKRNRLSEEAEHQLSVEYRSLEELLAESDIVSIHVPLTDATKGLIGKKEIDRMKDEAILINTAREHIMDEEAVAEALKNGKLSGVGVDTIQMEIVDDVFTFDSPLPPLENVVLTPHTAGASKEALIRANVRWVENVSRFLNGEKPLHIVNDIQP
jgi:lactate dehydrogenase-like 2-hydroxyacid dehydrogenase